MVELFGWVTACVLVGASITGLMARGEQRNRTMGRSKASSRRASDVVAMNRIWWLMNREEWDASLMRDIADVVELTGRVIEEEEQA